MPLTDARHIPSSTYRTQLNAGFTFPQLEEIVPYLRSLGIGDCYASPILFSPPGSTHGYDVSDYRRIDPELGGEPSFDRLAQKLRDAGMGLLVDVVPNHMGIRGPFNPWWLQVLECGRRSAYAHFFDIHWKGGGDGRENGRILVPILDDQYGIVLENGGLRLKCEEGALRIHFGTAYFPLRPASAAGVLEGLAADAACPGESADELRALAAGFREADAPGKGAGASAAAEVPAQLAELKGRLDSLLKKSETARRLLEAALQRLNGQPGHPGSFDELDRILDGQHYRLAHWKTGVFAANYRRFFAVDSLIGVRVEEADVFAETHALLGRLMGERKITGLRIDHIDGLWDPQQYLERLQALGAPASGPRGATYVVVEKILAGGETLPLSWPAHGTTGYEFITQCGRLFVSAAHEAELTEIYGDFTGRPPPFEEVAYEKKRLVLAEMFANTIVLLADRLVGILNADRRQRDLTHRELVVAIRETMAGMPVYRTYRRPEGGLAGQDADAIETAYHRAIRQNPALDPGTLRLIRDIIAGSYPPAHAPEGHRNRLTRWVLGFQQYTGAIMAKALEDTAFYVYNRLIALNEVGGDPGVFGGSIDDFHAANIRRRGQSPHALLATSTHDTKMSEDVRARLYVLSEIPREWESWIREWREINRPLKNTVDGQEVPDPNEEYRLYQVLLGAWPLEEDGVNDGFRARLREHVRKANNEARLNTTWIQPNEAWLEAGDRFIDALLSAPAGEAFRKSFRPKAERVAQLGMVNSLAQLVLKITSPGVPDFYQGNETWEFRLVDPDNRRPVDFAARKKLLEAVGGRRPGELLENWRDGGIKLFVTRGLLRWRREREELFARGDYVPLIVRGRGADQVVAFLRVRDDAGVLVAVPRQTAALGCPPLGSVWGDTTVRLPAPAASAQDVLTGRRVAAGAEISLANLFADLPFAVAEIDLRP